MDDILEQATFHLLAGEIESALALLDARMDSAPDDDTRRLRAEIYTAQNTPDSLIRAEADLAQIGAPTPQDGLHAALIFERMGDLPRAVAVLAEAARTYPDHMRLRQRWMELAFRSGDLTTAQHAIRGLPDDWRMLELAADLTTGYADATGEDSELLAQADTLYMMALNGLPDEEWAMPFRARILLARAGVNLRMNLPDEVAACAQSAAVLIPTEPACNFYVGWSLVKRGSSREGLMLVRRALAAASDSVRETLWRTVAADEDFQRLSQ